VIWKVTQPGQPGATVVRVAGNFNQGPFVGDGGPATAASLNNPQGVAVDLEGNLYIADSGHNRIREVFSKDGTITTIAGTGGGLYSGDGGAATNAQLNYPSSIALGPGGEIYVGDSGNHAIRRLTPPGAQMINPPPGSILPSSVSFSWSAVTGATAYQLDISHTIGAPGLGDISFSGPTNATSWMVNIPCDGRTLYVQLQTQIGGIWVQPARYTYAACPILNLRASPSSVPQQGTTVALTADVQNFSALTLTGTLQITESQSPPLENCQFNNGRIICTILPPVPVGAVSISLGPLDGTSASLNSSVQVAAVSRYGRTLHFLGTISSPNGAALIGTAIDVPQY
jgi:hypothetical protein